jgi:geranylgeranyl pyrophosphate synthase
MIPGTEVVGHTRTHPPPQRVSPSRIQRFVEANLPDLESELEGAIQVPAGLPSVLGDAARAALGLVGGGQGARWRPMLTLAVSDLLGGDLTHARSAAVAVELTHTASLVLDDLPAMDDSPLRRGKPSTHCRVGPDGAILLAVALLGRSAELLGGIPVHGGRLALEWGAAFGLAGMAGGQAVDLTGRLRETGAGRRLHRQKTTALSAFALRAGAVLSSAPEPWTSELGRFGRDVGWAYQLADDAADVAEDHRAQGQLRRGGKSPLPLAGRLMDRASLRLMNTPGFPAEEAWFLEAMGRATLRFPLRLGGICWS